MSRIARWARSAASASGGASGSGRAAGGAGRSMAASSLLIPDGRPRGAGPGSRSATTATRMPAASSAATFSAAVPRAAGDDGPGVAHALALGRGPAGDEGHHRDAPQVLRGPGRGLLLGRAADLADQHDRLGLGVGARRAGRTSRKVVPMIGSPPMPTQVRLADAGVGHRLDHLVGQGARSGRPRRPCPRGGWSPG